MTPMTTKNARTPFDANQLRRLATGSGLLAAIAVIVAASVSGLSGALITAAIALGVIAFGLYVVRWQSDGLKLKRLIRLHERHDRAEKMAALGLWEMDLQARDLHFSNGAFRVFGLPASEGEPSFAEFVQNIHPDDRKRWNSVHRRAIKRNAEVKLEYRIALEDGSERWLRSVARVVRTRGASPRLQGTVQDISGMRAMQRQLAASEAKFRDLTMLSSDWVWETDTQDRITYISDSVDAELGSWARSLLGRRRWESNKPDALPTDWSFLKTALHERRPFDGFEYTRVDEEGNLYHLSISGRPMFDERNAYAGYRGIAKHITREKQQRILLELDGDIAAIMREQTDPKKVITAVIITLCGKLGWLGGFRLVGNQTGRARVHERWGYPKVAGMIAKLPDSLPVDDNSLEARAWETGKAIWVRNVARERKFAQRYKTNELGAQAAFLAPISDENGNVLSALVFLGPVGFRGDQFLGEIAAVLSRSLSLYLQRATAEHRLRQASMHDALTGLPNRSYVGQRLDRLLARKTKLALLYIDLDRYKIINDTLGHSAGDKALIEVARRIKDALPKGDMAGRLGGDEFVAIIRDPDSNESVEKSARAVLHAIEQPLELNERAYFLSASIGIALAPADSDDAALLIKAADAAMYQVKSEGRNDVRFFSGDLKDPKRSEQLELVAQMPAAMRRGEVELFYQPVLDVSERRVLSIEGLMRWRHPKLGLLLPDQFLPIAEQSNQIREIGFWAIRRAIEDRIELGLDRYDELAVSVNISVRQLSEEGFLDNVANLIQENGFPAHLLILELTESSFIEDPDRTVNLINQFRELGVKVIIDNFGTGYASLSYIKDLPVDGLKIDRAFVSGLPQDRGNAAIVQAVTTLAAKLGMQAMAEGVETTEEMRGLREMQCDTMQGALICEPVEFADLQAFLDSLPSLRKMHLVSSNGKRAA